MTHKPLNTLADLLQRYLGSKDPVPNDLIRQCACALRNSVDAKDDDGLVDVVNDFIKSGEPIIITPGTRHPRDKSIALGFHGWSHHNHLRAVLASLARFAAGAKERKRRKK